ncbi:hydrogenase maturation protease [Chloroflexota bacterium]
MRQPKEIVICGLGNPLMSDEGIGLYVVRELAAKAQFADSIDFVELGSSLTDVVHTIAGRRKAVLVDCAFMNEPAGSMHRFTPDEVASEKAKFPLSLHQGDLLDMLELSRWLGEYPEEVVIYGIQPECVTMGDCLSPSLQQRLGSYVTTISTELQIST